MEYIYLESKLAEMLGLSQATMRKGRRMFLKDEDFGMVAHGSRKQVAYTHKAAERIIDGMAKSSEFGSRATRSLEASDIALVLSSSVVREAAASEQEEKPAKKNSVEPTPPLLNDPWKVPAAVLVVVRITTNRRIVEAVLHPDWVEKHGFEYYYRVLVRGLLREHELQNPDLFKSKLFRVKVKNNSNFVRGMEVKAEWVQQDLWECTNQRMPRYKGRW